MSIVLQNYVQVSQGARVKPMQPLFSGGLEFFKNSEFIVTVSYLQIFIVVLTIILMGIFTYLITKTDLGRAQRACEQDRTMTALLGINVDRTISITFIKIVLSTLIPSKAVIVLSCSQALCALPKSVFVIK